MPSLLCVAIIRGSDNKQDLLDPEKQCGGLRSLNIGALEITYKDTCSRALSLECQSVTKVCRQPKGVRKCGLKMKQRLCLGCLVCTNMSIRLKVHMRNSRPR